MTAVASTSSSSSSSLVMKKRSHIDVEQFSLLTQPDPLVTFDVERHKYCYDGEEMAASVTEHVDYYSGEKFDAITMSEREFAFCRRFAQDPGAPHWTEYQRNQYEKYKYCTSPEEIRIAWEAARDNGTMTHESVHLMLTGRSDDSERFNTTEMLQFRGAHAHLRHQFYPLMSEVAVVLPQISTGGSIDAVYALDDGFTNRLRKKVAVVEIKTMPMPNDNAIKARCKYPFENVKQSKIGKVTIQTSFYGKMLQLIGGYEIVAVFVIYLHKSMLKYGLLSLPFLDREMDQVMIDLAFRYTLPKVPTCTLAQIRAQYKEFIRTRPFGGGAVGVWRVLPQEGGTVATSTPPPLPPQPLLEFEDEPPQPASDDDDDEEISGSVSPKSKRVVLKPIINAIMS